MDVGKAVRNLEGEREGIIELHDENTALRIYNRRLRLVVDYALQMFDICERDLTLFITPKVLEMIAKSRGQIRAAEKAISESRGWMGNKSGRRIASPLRSRNFISFRDRQNSSLP